MQKLKHLRELNGLTQAKLAEKVNMTQSQICKIENGERYLKAKEAFLFAHVLGVSVSDLLSDVD